MKGIFAKAFERILNVWRATGTLGSRLTIWFVAALIAICAGCVLIGAVPTFVFGHDNFFLLENGWRVLHGLRPHLDFWSPWGPLTFLVVALGLKLSHGSPNGLAYGNAIFALVIGVWIYRVGRGRLAQAPRSLLAIYAAVLACSPHPVGLWPMILAPAMIYNRYGYALLVLVLMECFQRPDTTISRSEEWLGGLSTGAAIGLALFLKASYFLAGMGFVVVSLLLWFPSVRRLLGILTGFGVVFFLGIAYLRFQLPAMLRALRMAAGARTQMLTLKAPIHNIANTVTAACCVLALAVAAAFLKPRRPHWLGDFYLPVAAMIVYIADIALLTTNSQTSGLPLLGAFALLIANQLAEVPKESLAASQQFSLPYYGSVLLLSALLFLPQFTSDVMALPIAAVRKIDPPPGCAVRFTEPRVAALILCDRSDEDDLQKWYNGRNYTTYVNDGAALLRRCCTSSDKVLVMDMQNPFPYVLGWLPARGGMAATAFNYTFSARFRPSWDDYFGDATVVMTTETPALAPQYSQGLYDIYGPAVEQRFYLATESDWFRLYKRN